MPAPGPGENGVAPAAGVRARSVAWATVCHSHSQGPGQPSGRANYNKPPEQRGPFVEESHTETIQIAGRPPAAFGTARPVPPMIIIPWNTDAALYHPPIVTVGLIAVNVAAFGLILADPAAALPGLLVFGDGLHPVQWVTNVFMHGGILHLVGNMFFLWGFGLIVEGKIGWWRFLLLYLALGAIESAISQVAMLDGEGAVLGASGAIFGLMAVALVWAPRNELSCLGFFGFRPYHFDVSVLGYVTFSVIVELALACWGEFEMSSQMLHLAGAVPGFAIGAAMVKWDFVDCEHWDVFAVLAGRPGEAPRKVVAQRAQAMENAAAAREAGERKAALAHIETHLEHGRASEALALHERMKQRIVDWQLSQATLMKIIKALHANKLFAESVAPLVDYLRAAPDAAPRVRLRLAQILIGESRFARARAVLEKIPAGSLDAQLEPLRRKLLNEAVKNQQRGEIEVDDGDW